MKKLTDIIKENNLFVQFKYSAKINISGTVAAENEGAAGEQVDKDIDVIVDHLNKLQNNLSDGTYEIIDIEEKNSITESIDNNKVLESLDADREGELHIFAQQIAEQLLSREELEFLIKRISIEFKQNSNDLHSNDIDDPSENRIILNMENVHTVPEATHVITEQDYPKIVAWLESEGDTYQPSKEKLIGKTLTEASKEIGPIDFEDETLQHLIADLFVHKYVAEY